MGQKVHPVGFRLGISAEHSSRWYAERAKYRDNVEQDFHIREMLRKRLKNASCSRIQIERLSGSVAITVHTARPGIVIGKKGEDIDRLRLELGRMIGMPVKVNVEEIRKPELDAYLVAESVAQQLERRIMFRRAMRRAVSNAMRLGAGGIKIQVSGRLNGAEIARTEWYREGRVPLHTLRADVDYGTAEAETTYGIIGIKVWLFKGEVFAGANAGDTAAA
ncbi:MAG: 30S ribosomal protein S3 [Oceanococcaceae bacterium]